MKILIADKLSPVGVDWLKSKEGVEVDVKLGLSPQDLAKVIGEYDGMIIRSGAKVTAEVLAESGKLRCIARAGVGVDNIDVPTATSKGIMVMNTPGGNTVSTAELTVALMMALSRNVSPANASLRSGQWNRKAYQGTQLAGKALGVVGMGRIGKAVARRALGLQMRVIGYDPFLSEAGVEGAIEMAKDLADLCTRADYITVHTPKSDKTLGMIGAEQFAVMKPTVRLINAARGGIIDPQALLDALEAGKVAGAALDVYTSEPPETDSEKKLIQHPKVLAVPHLGASTEEAQEQVALEAAQQLVDALSGAAVRNALNAPGFDGALPPQLIPYTELAGRMGRVLTAVTPGAVSKVEITYRGAISEMDTTPITTYLLVGLLSPHMDEPVNVINAPLLARERGIEIEQITTERVKNFANVMEVKISTDEAQRSCVGTIFGNRYPRIIEIQGYRMELKPEGHVVIIINDDRPGVVGRYGSIFGANNINIADMTFSRKKTDTGMMAVVGINLDQPPTDAIMDEIRAIDFVKEAYCLHLPELPLEEREE